MLVGVDEKTLQKEMLNLFMFESKIIKAFWRSVHGRGGV